MTDLFRKTLYAGLGLAFMTKGKIEELSKELVEAGKLTEKEGRELFAELTKKSEEAGKKVRAQVDSAVRDALKKMDLVTRDDLEALDKRVAKLKRKIADLEANAGKDESA